MRQVRLPPCARRQREQSPRHFFGGGVSIAGENKLVERAGLLRDRGGDARVAMAMSRNPPAGNGVDQRRAIRQMEQRAFGAYDMRDRLVEAMLGEGMPDGRSHGPVP